MQSPPLLEVILEIQFGALTIPAERLQYIRQMLVDHFPEKCHADPPFLVCYRNGSTDHSLRVLRIAPDQIELRSRQGISFSRLKDDWIGVTNSLLDTIGAPMVKQISLSYLNEIPLQDLKNFRDYLNIGFEMPASLQDRFEFFRSEFTYKYDFGEIRVWLQPDWDEEMDGYCIQLNLESRRAADIHPKDLLESVQQLHIGLRDVFRQILSEDYVRQLPQ